MAFCFFVHVTEEVTVPDLHRFPFSRLQAYASDDRKSFILCVISLSDVSPIVKSFSYFFVIELTPPSNHRPPLSFRLPMRLTIDTRITNFISREFLCFLFLFITSIPPLNRILPFPPDNPILMAEAKKKQNPQSLFRTGDTLSIVSRRH